MTQSISAKALAVLREMECDSDRARITSGQLDRPLYEEVNEVLVRLGGKWKGGRTRAHLFPYDPRPLLAGVLATGQMPPKNPWAFFPTPQPLVDSVMQSPLFDKIQDGDTVLEPSAGFGALALGMRQRLAHRRVQIDCCEILPINQQVLREKGFQVVHDDFLTYHPEKRYRAIVMNPPFSVEKDKLAYITHILHAWDLLADGGFLIAFAPAGYTFRADRKAYSFLSFVLTYGGWEELPAKSFHESGTDSRITLITLEKQDQSWRYQPYNGCPSWFCWDLALLADNGNDEFYRVQQRIIEQLNSGDLCSNPKLPAWSRTRDAIRDYYQRVIEYARKNSHRHLDIRPQDWPFLERRFMMHWDDTWEAGSSLQDAPAPESPITVEATHKAPVSKETSLYLNDETGASEPGMPVETGEPLVSPPCPAGTPLYSPLPSGASYEQLFANYEEISAQPRDCYPALPWCMEVLVGTIWRNIHTGEAQTVHHLGMNRFGKPVLCAAPANPAAPFGQDLEIIGFWSGDRYIVEHWVRVDHQSEEAQLCWFGVELAWLSRQILFCEDKIAEYRWDTTNRNLQKRAKKDYQLRLQEAEARMREFADRHHLSIPLEVLNSGIIGSERSPAQMVMF
ncbi:MAG TPA: methyltransferase [Ktedonobacteraceae bacterium]|nr:methyltransferase [Ktedonobacteraceae bacterium]